MSVTIKSEKEIEYMRDAGKILAQVHEQLSEIIEPGITTMEITKKGEEFIRNAGAYPSFKGYEGYPEAICVSINDEVVHGIPCEEHRLFEGDIVSLDAGVEYKGYQSDAARTYGVGKIDEESERLIRVTRESFFKGIEYARAGNHLYDISRALQKHAESQGFSIVRDLCGHGIGKVVHEEPAIPNFKPWFKRGIKLVPGMTLAIEPMVNAGTRKVWILDDDWTVITRDGKKSAHYENTILVTENDPEILSL